MRYESIKNADALIRVYGSWPWFHDAEVTSLLLQRDSPNRSLGFDPPSLEIVLADREGPTPTPWLVTLRFTGVRDIKLEGFNQQNVLFEMDISPLLEDDGPAGWRTVCSSSHGLSGEWVSDGIEVVSVAPLSAPV